MAVVDIDDAVARLRAGGLVVYPTETVYGLGADALDPEAIERVFEAKRRSRAKPVSLAVESIDAIGSYAQLTDRERAFCERFLPGPVTVLLERQSIVPDVLVAGRPRVGVRVPDHEVARELARQAGPITATSANRSGQSSARIVADIDPDIRERATVLDVGETPGGESTVVDVSAETVVRRGALANDIEAWLDGSKRQSRPE